MRSISHVINNFHFWEKTLISRVISLIQHLRVNINKETLCLLVVSTRQKCLNQHGRVKSQVKETALMVVFAIILILIMTSLSRQESKPILLLDGADRVVAVRLPDGNLVEGVKVSKYMGKGYREDYW